MVWVPELHMIQESNLESRVDCTYAAYGMLTGQYLSNSGASDDSSLCIVPEDSVIDLDSSTIGSRITSDTASISWSSRPSITSTLETDLSDGASWQKEAFLLPTLDTQVSLETEIGQIDQTTLPLSSFNDDDDDTDTEDSSHRRFSIYSDMDRSIASLSPAWTRKLRAKVSNATLTGSISSSAKSLLSSRWSRMSLEMPGPGLSTVDEELRLGRGSDLAVEPLWKIAAWKLGKAGRTVRDLRKLLRSCALSNDLFRLRLVLETGKVDPDHRFDDGETALLLAVEAGHIAVVECLLVTGHITPDLRDANGDTALARAAKRGRVDIMRLLLCRGAQPDTMNSVFRTPLHHSVFHKYDLATEELLRTGQVNVDAVDTCGHSPLSEASPR
ncbi:Hypothetical protein D9617_1g084720 [Elsinoe fawcettii]|nr:Hypothetical protein D9617_1g084720 [Elsinoe fawcettii]